MSKTSISWTEHTWNVVTGCTRASAGCDHCYAVRQSRRLAAMGQEKYKGLVNPGKGHFNGVVRLHEHALSGPLKRRKPTMYFVCSMSDLFHKDVPFDFIDKVFATMALCPQHTFQVLTKRPERMAAYLLEFQCRSDAWSDAAWGEPALFRHTPNRDTAYLDCDSATDSGSRPLENVWLGTSVENQETADERIPHLLRCPARVRFLSCEPLLGPVDLSPFFLRNYRAAFAGKHGISTAGMDLRGEWYERSAFIDWVIIGLESGPKARPGDIEWIRALIRQCRASGTACFVKQLGRRPVVRFDYWDESWSPAPQITLRRDGLYDVKLDDSKGADMSEWPEGLRVREFPQSALVMMREQNHEFHTP